MRASRAVLAISVAAVMVLPGASFANHVEYDTAEECMRSGSYASGLPTCTKLGSGGWRASHTTQRPGPGGSLNPGAIFGTVLVIWLILVAGSVAWVVSTANKHGDPVGTALLGALVGGPLFVLMYGTNSDLARRGRKLYRWTDRIPAEGPPPGRNKAERLKELERLRDEDLVSDVEYEHRRNEILDEI